MVLTVAYLTLFSRLLSLAWSSVSSICVVCFGVATLVVFQSRLL